MALPPEARRPKRRVAKPAPRLPSSISPGMVGPTIRQPRPVAKKVVRRPSLPPPKPASKPRLPTAVRPVAPGPTIRQPTPKKVVPKARPSLPPPTKRERDARLVRSSGGNFPVAAGSGGNFNLNKVTSADVGHAKSLPGTKPDWNRPAVKRLERLKLIEKGYGGTALKGGTLVMAAPDPVRAAGLKVLEQTVRPLHGVAGGARAVVQGKNLSEINREVGKGLKNETKYTGSDVLKAAGVKNRTVRAVGGLGLDYVFDPLTHGRASGLSAQQALLRQAGRTEVKAAKAATRGRAVRAAKQSDKAAVLRRQAGAASTAKGIQIGFAGKVPFGPHYSAMTSGKTTAKIGKKLAPVVERASTSKVGEAWKAAFVPTARRAGETATERDARVYAERLRRSRMAEGERKAERRGTAHARAAKGVDVPATVAAVEQAAKTPLTATKMVTRKTEAHKAVPRAERRLAVAERKLAKERGRAAIQREEARRAQAKVPSRAEFIAQRPRPARGHPDPTLEKLVANVKPGKPGISIQSEHIRQYDPRTKETVGFGAELGHSKVVVARDAQGKPIGALHIMLDARGKPNILEVAVDPAHRGRGIGSKLYETAQRAGLDVESASGRGGLTEAGAALAHKRLVAKTRAGVRAEVPQRLIKAQGAARVARQQHVAAREAAKGVPKRETYLIDTRTGQRYEDWKATAPTHQISELPPKAQTLARATQAELGGLKTRQQQAGVLESERPNYYPHRVIPEATKGVPKILRRGRAAKTPYAKKRGDVRPIAEIEAERAAKGQAPLFTTDQPTVMAHYTKSAERAIADSAYLNDLKEKVGKPLTASSWAKRRKNTDALYRITPTGIQAVKKPNGKDLGEADVQQLIAKGDDVTILPRETGDAEMAGRASSPTRQKVQAAIRLGQRPIQTWKTAATVLNLPFHQVRNFMDEAFRGWAAGATTKHLADATRLIKDKSLHERRERTQLTPTPVQGTVTVAGREMPREQFLKQASDDILGTGYHAAEELLPGSIKPSVGIRRVRPITKIREWGQRTEDVPRLASYMSALDRGLSRQEAANHTRLYHFDYSELTDVERAIRGTLIPFYTYTRKNTPLMARLFFTQPGKLSAIQKLREEANKWGADDPRYQQSLNAVMPSLQEARKQGIITQAEIDAAKRGNYESLLSETDQRGMPFMGPGGKLYYMPLGATDLNRIPFATTWEGIKHLPYDQYQQAMALLGPIPFKAPIELGENHSFFFRNPIYRSVDQPDAQKWVAAPPWAAKLGIPTEKREIGGRLVDAWDAKTDYLMRLLPQGSLAASAGSPVQNARGQTWGSLLQKQVTGVRSANIDDRILAGMIERAVKRRGRLQVEINNRSDVPGGRGKSQDKFFFTKDYQGLLDQEKAIGELLKTLRDTRNKTQTVAPKRLARRPLTPQELFRQKVQKARQGADPAQIRQQIIDQAARARARQKIISGGP